MVRAQSADGCAYDQLMSTIINSLVGRFGPAGRVADAAIVGGAALKYAHRKGLVSGETARKLGAPDSPAGSGVSMGELILVAMAVMRLLRHFSKKRERVTVIEV